MDDLTLQVEELKMSIDGLEKERDFYFAKLRDIEVFKKYKMWLKEVFLQSRQMRPANGSNSFFLQYKVTRNNICE